MSVKISELPVLAPEDVAAGDVVAIVDSSEGVTKQVDLSGVLAGGGSGVMASGRNLIINGSGRINQRGYTSGTATTSANQFTLDRWFVVTSGQSLTFTGDDSRRVMTAPAGGVAQVIKGSNITGGTYVLNWDGTATATVNGTARAKGETFTLPANANATVRFSSGTFTDVQLERDFVTPFEERDEGEELRRCQRYFERLRAAMLTQQLAATDFGYRVTYLVEKQAIPSVTIQFPTNINSNDIRAGSVQTTTLTARARCIAAGFTEFAADFLLSAELTS